MHFVAGDRPLCVGVHTYQSSHWLCPPPSAFYNTLMRYLRHNHFSLSVTTIVWQRCRVQDIFLPVTFFGRHVHVNSCTHNPVELCNYELKSNYKCMRDTRFQSITDSICDFRSPFMLLIFYPVRQYFYPPTMGFTFPNDKWTGLPIKLW